MRQWKRRVAAWQLRAANWLPPEELGLVLLDSLQGDAALLVQDVPLARITQGDGVEHLLGLLSGMEQQRIQSYGSSMKAYESLMRKPGELIKPYD
eukprot:2790216-Amphidinium_carterae.2